MYKLTKFPASHQGHSGLTLPKTSQRKALGSISPHLIPLLLFEKFLKLNDSVRGEKTKTKGEEIIKTQPLTN